MDLFTPQVDPSRQHRVFKMLLEERYAAERAVLTDWAAGYADRDGKFVQEFQMTFESGLWELYLNASIRAWDMKTDISFASPDFVVTEPLRLCMEATIAGPAKGGKPAIGYDIADIPKDFTEFNVQASIRICNSFSAKIKRYREYYAKLAHAAEQPFVMAIASFDRPGAHFAASRPMMAALYGLYHDEAATSPEAEKVVSYNVGAAPKSKTVDVPLCLFCDDTFADVSAVIYSSLATWGKVRALADNPSAPTVYTTFHPKEGSIYPEIRKTLKGSYQEHLLDGMWVLHNPFAKRPIPPGVFTHPRLAEVRVAPDGELLINSPDDFLLVRTLITFPTQDAAEEEMRRPIPSTRGSPQSGGM
jgi:hypothetical protein